MSAKPASEASVEVLDGEVVVTWSNPSHKRHDEESQARQRVREMVAQNREATYGEGRNRYTVHKGSFKFFFRKSLYECGDEENPELSLSGEFYLDPEWSRKVFQTKVVL